MHLTIVLYSSIQAPQCQLYIFLSFLLPSTSTLDEILKHFTEKIQETKRKILQNTSIIYTYTYK